MRSWIIKNNLPHRMKREKMAAPVRLELTTPTVENIVGLVAGMEPGSIPPCFLRPRPPFFRRRRRSVSVQLTAAHLPKHGVISQSITEATKKKKPHF